MAELTINTADIASALRKNLEDWKPGIEAAQVGRVTEVGDGIATVGGLPDAAVNELLAGCAGSHRLVRVSGEWHLHFAPSRPLSPLEAIARSAAATLADRTVVVRRCAGEGCSLFIDSSPTRSRRWCSPAACGASLRVERRRGMIR